LGDTVSKNDSNKIRLNKRLVSLSEDTDQARLEFEDSSVEEAECVLAADGMHSTIRSVLYDEFGAEFTGHVAYRGLVTTAAVGGELMGADFNIRTGPGAHFLPNICDAEICWIMSPLSKTLTGKPSHRQAQLKNRSWHLNSKAGTKLFANLPHKRAKMNVSNGLY
jgi:hypothetical protein